LADPSAIVGPVLDTVAVSHDVEGMSYEESEWCINSFLLCLFTTLAKPSRIATLIVKPRGYKAGSRSYAQHTSFHMISHRLPTSFPMAEKERNRKTNLEIGEGCWAYKCVASPSLLNHGKVGLDRAGGHAREPAKPCESGVYDGGGAHVLMCA
jgi:hypothetical protein